MGKRKTQHVEGRAREERIQVRKKLGKLRDLTVQGSTRKRYDAALQAWGNYLRDENISLPSSIAHLDPILGDYIEHLWCTGCGRALASDTVAAVQDKQPQTRNRLPTVWRLLKAWSMHELPNRAPPLPEPVLQAMTGLCFFRNDYYMGISLLLGFYGMLRTGEILNVKVSDVTISRERGPAVIALGYTKGGRRAGAAESITVGVEPVCKLLWKWIHSSSRHQKLCPASHIWRAKFNELLETLKFESFSFRPYRLRRGGSTFWFQQHGSLDRLCVQGRWASQKTARIYVNEGLALLAEITLPWTPGNKVFVSQYLKSCKAPVPKLEPTDMNISRPGGRGKGKQRGRNGSHKAAFLNLKFTLVKERVGVSIFLWLGGKVGSTLGLWLPWLLAWRESGEGSLKNNMCEFFVQVGFTTLFD